MARLSKEQRKERRKQRRIKKALRSYRFRTLKNFLIWLVGLISSGIITVGVIALCLAVIPISTFTGGEKNEYVSEKVANNTLLNVIMNIQDYDMSDIPIVADSLDKMIKDAGIDEYVEIDTAKMKTLKFDANFTNELTSCIKVVATLESINGLEMLGDIGKLNVFTEWEEIEIIVNDESTPDVDESENCLMPEVDNDGNIAKDDSGNLKANPKMYYYKVESGNASGGGDTPYSEQIEGDNSKYERAFDDNGVKVNGYDGGTLYFPAVAKISILDAVQVLGESFGRVQIVNLLENFGAGELTDSMIGKVLEGKRIRDMASINANGILLADVLNYDLENEENNTDSIKQMFDILIAAVESEEELTLSNVTIGHLTSGFNVEGISLDVVLKEESNADLYKILRSAIGLSEGEAVTIGSLSGIKPENITLESVLERNESNAKLYEILDSVIKEPEDKKKGITIGDLSSIDADSLNNLSLGVVMPEADSLDLYKILRDATGIESGDITIADLKNIGSDFNIKISTVMTLDDNLMTMICDAVNEYRVSPEYSGENVGQTVDKESVTIQDLTDLKPDYIKLDSVMPYSSDNAVLYKVLLDSAGIPWTDSNIETQASGLTIKDIKFNTDNVKISSVMSTMDEDTLTLIREAINANPNTENQVADNSELTIGHISSLDPNYIKLTSVITCDETNEKMWRLLLEGTGETIRYGSGEFLSVADLKLLADEMVVSELNIDVDQVRISTVMPDMNGTLKTILTEAFPSKEFNEIKVSDLGSTDFSLDNVHLHSVMPSVDSHLKSILADAFMNTYNGDDYKTDGVIDKEKVFKAITIGDLSTGFSVDSIRLETVVTAENTELELILAEMFADKYNPDGELSEEDVYKQIVVADLANFNIANIRLNSLGLKKNESKIVDALIGENPLISDLSSTINSLSLYDIYGKGCFVTLADVNNDTTQLVTTD